MTVGTCTQCNKEYKNLQAHSRFCKSQSTVETTKNIETIPPIVDDMVESLPNDRVTTKPNLTQELQGCSQTNEYVKADTNTHKPKRSIKEWLFNMGKRPIIIKSHDKKYDDTNMTEQERIRNLLKDAPLWTGYKPSGITKFLGEKMNPGKSFAPCVFVSEARQPKILYLPYEPEKHRLIIPEKGFYIPSQVAPPFFFHEDYCLELIHTPVLKDRFNVPAHLIESKYNAGIMEGTLKSGKELLDEIKKYKMVCYMLGGIVILALFLVVFIGYTTDNHVKVLAAALNNNTIAINGMNRMVP